MVMGTSSSLAYKANWPADCIGLCFTRQLVVLWSPVCQSINCTALSVAWVCYYAQMYYPVQPLTELAAMDIWTT